MTREEVLKLATDWFKGDDLRATVWVDKYCLREGDEYLESTPDDMFKRLATEFARIEMKYPKPMSYDEIYELLKDFKYVLPGGSILYGVGNEKSYTSLGNCFVIGDQVDSYGSIMKIDEEQVQLMKRRGGVGHDLSHLRPKGTPTTNSANNSTGAVSFMHRYSNSTREVGQDGRRGALMLSMNISHPDIEEFITTKDDLTKVTGANISVKITDDFMQAVKNNEDYALEFFSDVKVEDGTWKTYGRTVNARELWNKIIHQAWKSAEPGVLFWDHIINNSPADIYPGFKSISTNPCGEIPLCAYDTCRLMSVNLFSFVVNPFTFESYFDVDKFKIVVKKAQRLMDDVIDLEEEKINKILKKIKSEERASDVEVELWEKIKEKLLLGRRTGLSAIGLADCFAALGIQYGSDESIAFSNLKYKLFHDAAYKSSEEMADQRGPFPLFNKYRADVKRLNDEDYLISGDVERRNIALLTIPPSGTISMLAGISSGIEPVFALEYTRRRKVETSDKVAYVDKNGDKWEEYKVYHPGFTEWAKLTGNDVKSEHWNDLMSVNEIKSSPYFGSTANEIDPMKRVELQATIQRWIDHSISSTINLPNDTTEDVIADIYMKAWELGCKGITVYRDGCRDGVLLTKGAVKMNKFTQHDAPKRPKKLEGDIKYVKVKGVEHCVITGLYEGKPYEVFARDNTYIWEIMKPNPGKCVIIKEDTGVYNIEVEGEDYGSITELLSDEQAAITRLISTSLRHGTDIKFLVEQLNKTKGDLTSFSKAIARVLKNYVGNGSHLKGSLCDVCGSELVMENGCEICKACAYTKCS